MDKKRFLNSFSPNMEREATKLYHQMEKALNTGEIVYSDEFYTPSYWKRFTNNSYGLEVKSYGYFNDADRRQIAFIPKDVSENFSFPTTMIKIKVNSKFHKFTHRDFLGSLMGLSIKRELFGDMIVDEDKAYIPVANKILDHVLIELTQVGKSSCKVELCTDKDIPVKNYEDTTLTVSSLRLDSLVSAITNLSRNKVVELIEKQMILIDYLEELEKSKNVDIDSIITIKGYGKYKLFSENGETKKNKKRMIIRKYI